MELDGRSVTADEPARLVLYNYGHFTTMRVDAGRVRGLPLRLRRLVNDCAPSSTPSLTRPPFAGSAAPARLSTANSMQFAVSPAALAG